MDETWGLTWSRRWHKINPESTSRFHQPGYAVALCSVYIYTQEELREARAPRHLSMILAEPEKAAGICKKCEKKAADATR